LAEEGPGGDRTGARGRGPGARRRIVLQGPGARRPPRGRLPEGGGSGDEGRVSGTALRAPRTCCAAGRPGGGEERVVLAEDGGRDGHRPVLADQRGDGGPQPARGRAVRRRRHL